MNDWLLRVALAAFVSLFLAACGAMLQVPEARGWVALVAVVTVVVVIGLAARKVKQRDREED